MRITLIIVGLILTLLTSCDRFGSCYGVDCTSPPNPVRLSVVSGDTDLIYSNYYSADSIGIFLITENGELNLIESYTHKDTLNERVIISCVDMAWNSLEGFNDYCLKYNSQESDTIFLKVISVTENCCNFHPISDISINGEVPKFDNELHCFLIEKNIN